MCEKSLSIMINVMYGGGARGGAASCSVFVQEGPVHFIELMLHEKGDLSEDMPEHKWMFLELSSNMVPV